jgi:hypothetical protein
MAPELVELGDRLEAAANRSVSRRRARRQLALNAAASLIVAVPITVTVATTQFTTTTTAVPVTRVSPAPTASGSLVPQVLPSGLANRDLITDEEDAPSSAEFLPRDLHRLRLTPQSELLLLPSSLRPALR